MSRDAIKQWYREAYPDDPAQDADHFIVTGYEAAYHWHGVIYDDAFEALAIPEIRELLNNRAYEIRAFIRAYNQGALDKPEIVEGAAAKPVKMLGGG